VFAVSALVVSVPDVPFVPVQPPDAVQLVAFVVDQVSCEVPPEAIDAGAAENASVGAGCVTFTVVDAVCEPPLPVHVRL
jgi:hypothetical protein